MHEEYYTSDFENDDANHWWFKARRKILKALIRKIDFPGSARILDIGTGTGANLYSIFPENAVLHGLEPSPELAAIADNRGRFPVYVGTADEFPPQLDEELFDAITMFDVLEHTEDDRLVLENLSAHMPKGGWLIITVPAYMFLWSPHDVATGHYRRYRRPQLQNLLREFNFEIERSTYFNTLLLLPVICFRLGRRALGLKSAGSDTRFSPGLFNTLLYKIFSLEKHLLPWLNFPAGISILAIARKR